jgi:sigma-B regulation protein RsbU (phosphoserine phosphatase)
MSKKSVNSPTGPIKMDQHRMARLVEISRTLNASTNLHQLLSTIIDEAAALVSCEAASILLLDPQTRQLHFRASSNAVDPQLADHPVSLDNSIAGAILTQNQPMYIKDVTKDPRWNKNVDQKDRLYHPFHPRRTDA